MTSRHIKKYYKICYASYDFLESAIDKLGLSAIVGFKFKTDENLSLLTDPTHLGHPANGGKQKGAFCKGLAVFLHICS